MMEFILAMGIPTSIMGILVWWLKRHIDKREAEAEKRDQKTERFMLLIMQNTRATNVLAEATAKAVQRIPDAHCNGDMSAALEQAARIQKEEQQFLFDQGVEHIFGN